MGIARFIMVLAVTLIAAVLGLSGPNGTANALAATEQSGMPQVLDARVGRHREQTRFVLEFDQTVRPDIFTLADDYRLVIDLPEVQWNVDGGALLQGAGEVSRVRYARNRPGRSRVVLDLAQPLSIVQREMIAPRGVGGKYRFVLDLERVSHDTFMRTAGWPARHKLVGAPAREASAAPAPGREAPVPAARPAIRAGNATQRVIVIDPGHGGRDPGAIGVTGVYEKTVALKMAEELRDLLENTGRYRVHMTRTGDSFITLPDRVAFARDHQADLFISIHADSNPDTRVRGTSVYTLSERASDRAAARLAQKENAINGLQSEDVNDDVLKILIELAQRDTMNNSVRFAQTLLPAMKSRDVGLLRNTHRFGPFWVLTAADVPSVLLEMGFLSNSRDSALMTSPEWRGKLAAGILDSLDDYFGYGEFAELR